uniref:Uncharacterized protein n=1 Tax=Rhodnius prolixus TaxID=13249 RepID=T1HGL2_RHOPR
MRFSIHSSVSIYTVYINNIHEKKTKDGFITVSETISTQYSYLRSRW